jgi:DNA-binding transcriptional regulator YdaS (Cro superfamily)
MEKLRTYLNSLSTPEKIDFARRCDTSIGYLRKAISMQHRVDAKLCIAFERESKGVIRCEDVRPDADWPVLRRPVVAA